MNNLRLITFDATGTLIKFRKPPVETYLDISLQYGLSIQRKDIEVNFKNTWKELTKQKPHFGDNWREWWTEFVFKTLKTEKREVAEDLILHFTTGSAYEWQKGALETLGKLGNVKIGIISNSDPRLKDILKSISCGSKTDGSAQNSIIESIKKGTFFNPTILSHDYRISKPDRRIFDLARQQFDFQPSECLHVGDHLQLDYEAAQEAGWNAIHFQGEFSPLLKL